MLKKPTAALLALLCGCSTTATISRSHGRPVEATLYRSDNEALFARTEQGVDVVIPRAEVTDIDHPGNAIAIVGALLGAQGAVSIAAGHGSCGKLTGSMSAAYCVGTYLPAAIGGAMLVWGLATWANSSTSASDRSLSGFSGTVPTPPRPSPFDFSPHCKNGGASAARSP